MSRFLVSVLCAVLYGSFVTSIPIGEVSSSSSQSSLSSSSTLTQATSSTVTQTASSTLTETASSTSVGPSQPSPTVPYASDDPNYWLWNETTTTDPQPERGTLGASILGPQDIAIDKQNPDILAPPTTDSGTMCVPLCLEIGSRGGNC